MDEVSFEIRTLRSTPSSFMFISPRWQGWVRQSFKIELGWSISGVTPASMGHSPEFVADPNARVRGIVYLNLSYFD